MINYKDLILIKRFFDNVNNSLIPVDAQHAPEWLATQPLARVGRWTVIIVQLNINHAKTIVFCDGDSHWFYAYQHVENIEIQEDRVKLKFSTGSSLNIIDEGAFVNTNWD